MKDLMFFDADCGVGNAIKIYPDVKELFSDMDYYGVEKALVRHNNINNGILSTNKITAEYMKEDAGHRLAGVWCLLPDSCNELPEPDVFFDQMSKNRIKALTLSPMCHHYLPRRIVIGKIMDAALERKIPILLSAFSGEWDKLYDFLAEFPKNIYIFAGDSGKWGNDRNVRPLFEQYEHFHFTTAGYWIPEGIADMAHKYGAERILYGSGYPRYNQGNGMLQIKHSGLKDDEVAKIAGLNLEKLLKGAEL